MIDQPLDARNRLRYGVDCWAERQVGVEIVDLTQVELGAVYHELMGRSVTVEANGLIYNKPKTVFEVLRYLARRITKDVVLIDFASDTWVSGLVRTRFGLSGAKRVRYLSGDLPRFDDDPKFSLRGKLIRYSGYGIYNLVNRVVKKCAVFVNRSLLSRLFPYRLIVVSCLRANDRLPKYLSKNTKILKLHSFDYDRFREASSRKMLNKHRVPYAVFLDQDICFHTDYLHTKTLPRANPESYFPAICEFFRWIEKTHRTRVIVAAHPRAAYLGNKKQLWGEFEVSFGQTEDLIREAQVVFAHHSTAIGFAVLFEKPLVFLTTKDLEVAIDSPMIRGFATMLGADVLNVDAAESSWRIKTALGDNQRDKYSNYIANYLKYPGENTPSAAWAVVREVVIKDLR